MVENLVAQCRAVDVHINFGSLDALVPQHLLDGTQVGPSLKQMSSKRMSQRVRTHCFSNSCELTQLLDNIENHHSSELATSPVKEENVFTSILHHLVVSCVL